MILSKTPILSTRLFPLPKSALRRRHNMVVGVLEGVVELPRDGALRIYNTHLTVRSRHDRVAQIMSIRDAIRRAPAEGGTWTGDVVSTLWEEDGTPPPMPEPFVLLGDFNLQVKSPEYDFLVGPKDGDLGRVLSPEAFIDTWAAAGKDEDDGISYFLDGAAGGVRGRRPDYAFVAQAMAKRVLGARIDEAARGSDHQPYWLELDYAPHD
jgi:endonuclease/exonuclease/phosphatase family metal-dependent hydrolase